MLKNVFFYQNNQEATQMYIFNKVERSISLIHWIHSLFHSFNFHIIVILVSGVTAQEATPTHMTSYPCDFLFHIWCLYISGYLGYLEYYLIINECIASMSAISPVRSLFTVYAIHLYLLKVSTLLKTLIIITQSSQWQQPQTQILL